MRKNLQIQRQAANCSPGKKFRLAWLAFLLVVLGATNVFGQTNVALNKTATANQYVTGQEPAKAVDGLVNGKWCSNVSGDKWLKVDLGSSFDITRWVVKHAATGGEPTNLNTKNFKLQKSTDGNTWTDVDAVTNNTANITDRNVTSFSSRYLRLYITTPTQTADYAARICEFEAYGTVSDLVAPSVPTALTSSSVTQTSFTLNWTASTDNVGVTGYEVFRNGVSIGTTSSTSLSVTGLTCGTSYAMTVRARDAAANWSAQSSAQNVATSVCPDTQAPSVPTGLASSAVTQTSFTLNWTASTDNVGVASYEVFRNGNSIGTTASTSLSISGLTCATTYSMTVTAKDAAGNTSAASTALNVTTSACTGSTNVALNKTATANQYVTGQEPAKGVDGSVSSKWCSNVSGDKWLKIDLGSSFDITRWVVKHAATGGESTNMNTKNFKLQKSTDGNTWTDVDVVTNNTANITDRNVTSFSSRYLRLYITTPTQTTDYAARICEFEAYGPGSDTEAPSVPTALTSSNIAQTSFTLGWTASTDNVGVTAYEVFRNGVSIGTTASTSMSVSGLTAATTYTMTVKAKDAAGNTSASSSSLNVTTQSGTSTKLNHPGINLSGHGGCDYNSDKAWADAMRSHRNGYFSYAKDANYWATQDAQYLVYSGLKTGNNNGTYKLYFTGQAGSITVIGEGASVSNNTYNSGTNTSTADVVVTDPANSQIWLNFINTKRTAGSATNTGVTDIKLMRPTYAGSTTSYPTTQLFTDQFLAAIAPFEAIRFMDWTSTNACGDSLWSDRTLWSHACQAPPALPNRTYGWQGRGASWESVIKLCNLTGKDAWICVPHKCTDDYITKLAQLFKYGSDGVNPYTSTQSNPVHPPLNSNLKLYVEYSNEIWNWGSAFKQTPWTRTQSTNYGAPLNFDGESSPDNLMYRYKAMRSVQISTIFRSVFGDALMMTQVRPMIEWQQGYNDLTNRTLSFVDKYYNKRDTRSTVTTPHPVNYYFYGGGGSTYWAPNNASVTIDNIWTTGHMVASTWEAGPIISDANWAIIFGLKQCAYEGGAIEEYDIPDALKHQAVADSRIQNNYIEHQKAWNHVDGNLNMYFNLSSGDTASPRLSILCTTDKLNTYKWYAIQNMISSTPENVTAGSTAPFTRPGGAFDCKGYEAPNPNGTGSITLTANASYSTGYTFKVPTDGTYNVQIQYSTTATAGLVVDFAGNTIGTFNLPSTGGATTNTSYMNINCTANTLYGIRCVATSGSITIVNVIVGSGFKSAKVSTATDKEVNDGLNVSVYPNPATDHISVNLGGIPDNNTNITLTDISGKTVYRNVVSEVSNLMIPTDGFSKGIYILRVSNGTKLINKKLVIE